MVKSLSSNPHPPLFKDLEFPLLPFIVLAMSFVVLLSSLAPYFPYISEITSPLTRSQTTPAPRIQRPGSFCAGIAGIACPPEYECVLSGLYPDASGTCQPKAASVPYSCPSGPWVDCMPGPDRLPNFQCQPDYLDWARSNCPGFRGAAL